MAKPVILKKTQNTEIGYTYVVIPASEEEIKECISLRDISPTLVRYCIENDLCYGKEQIKDIYHCGKLDTFTGYSNLVYKFPQTKRQITERKPEQYRCYQFTLEQQKKDMHLVVLANTCTISWRSALTACGSKYGLILKIKYNVIKMNITAKYAGRVIQVKKPVDRHDKGDTLEVNTVLLKDNDIIIKLENNPDLILNIPNGVNNIEHWLGKLFKILY